MGYVAMSSVDLQCKNRQN